MGWPQYTILLLMGLSLGFTLAKDGQPKKDNYSFGWCLFHVLLNAGLLWAGGFFG